MSWDALPETTLLRLAWLGGNLVLLALALGTSALAGRLADRRERYRTALRAALTTAAATTPVLRDATLRYPWWGRAAILETTAAPAAVWRDLVQVARRLPASTRLIVRGAIGDEMASRFTVVTAAAPGPRRSPGARRPGLR